MNLLHFAQFTTVITLSSWSTFLFHLKLRSVCVLARRRPMALDARLAKQRTSLSVRAFQSFEGSATTYQEYFFPSLLSIAVLNVPARKSQSNRFECSGSGSSCACEDQSLRDA